MMSKNSGPKTEDPKAAAAPMLYLPIPEEMIPFMAGILRQAATRAEMSGQEIAAAKIQDFSNPLEDAMPDYLRPFSSDPEAFARALHAHDIGQHLMVIPDPDKGNVHLVTFDEKRKGQVRATGKAGTDENLDAMVEGVDAFFGRRERKLKVTDPLEGVIPK